MTAGTKFIPLDRITSGDRLRPAHDATVEVIKASMATDGLLQPIVVRQAGKTFRLVAGLHRLSAAHALGWDEIECTVRQLNERDAVLAEIQENVMRRELTALDRAVFLARAKEIYEDNAPETKHGGDRRSDEFQNDNLSFWSFTADVADRTNLSRKTIERAVKLARGLGPEGIAAIRGSAIEDNASEIAKLLRLAGEDRRDAFDALQADPTATVSTFLKARQARADGAEQSDDDAMFERIVALYSRSSKAVQARVRAHVSQGEMDV